MQTITSWYHLQISFVCMLSWVAFLGIVSAKNVSNETAIMPSGLITENDGKNTCAMFEAVGFVLDIACVRDPRSSMTAHQRFSTPSLDACKRACCQWPEGTCDFLAWGSSGQCLLMSYSVLTVCTLMVPIHTPFFATAPQNRLLFNSQGVPPHLKQALVENKINRERVRQIKCSNNDYICNDWSCIPGGYVCDGVSHCAGGSDEASCSPTQVFYHTRCQDRNGSHVKLGEEYMPYDSSGACKMCVCGGNGLPASCYSPMCSRNVFTSCDTATSLCCRCDINPEGSRLHLSRTQRLIISCMSVLLIITLLLFFSRNIVHRRRSNLHRHYFQQIQLARHNELSDDVIRRSFFPHQWGERSEEVDAAEVVIDSPPAYDQLKIVSVALQQQHDDSPPRYPGSNLVPAPLTPSAGEAAVAPDDSVGADEPDTAVQPYSSTSHTPEDSRENAEERNVPTTHQTNANDVPSSPISVTSDVPLL